MNADRRKKIAALIDRINEAQSFLAEIVNQIEEVRDEEQDYLDSLPDNMQEGEKAQRGEAAVDALDTAHSEIDLVDFSDAISSLENAAE